MERKHCLRGPPLGQMYIQHETFVLWQSPYRSSGLIKSLLEIFKNTKAECHVGPWSNNSSKFSLSQKLFEMASAGGFMVSHSIICSNSTPTRLLLCYNSLAAFLHLCNCSFFLSFQLLIMNSLHFPVQSH
jgi:hypothetical protein